MSQDKRTSNIWQHFTKIDSNFATCDLCKKKLSYKTSVTNLKKHLHNAHLLYSFTTKEVSDNDSTIDDPMSMASTSGVNTGTGLDNQRNIPIEPEAQDRNSIVSIPNPLKRKQLAITNYIPKKALIFRYEINGKPVERFWGYSNPEGHNAESLTQTILKQINPILEKNPSKLIAQSYDGAAVMSGQNSGVNVRVRETYPFANFIHCYTHQLNLIMTQATSQNKQIKIFFSNLSEIPVFFSNSPQRVAVLDDIVGSQLPRAVQTRWNFNIRTVNIVYEHRESLIECMEKILNISLQNSTINQATGLKRLLTDANFIFWLTIFHKIMPHVDCLYNVVQAKNTDAVQIQKSINCFNKEILKIRDDRDMANICEHISNNPDIESTSKRRRVEDNINSKKLAALEVCDIISIQAPKRLKTELEVMYSRDDFRNLCGVIPTINYLLNNNMEDTFKEVFKLLKLLVVIPMTSSEAERSFSTLKRIKTCLRSTMCEERLNALTMLSIESSFINEDDSFNQKVIDEFVEIKERRMDFVYKVDV
eukprot:XP_008182878.1 PREDICTED: uncharacterized protein LOC103309376 [Acyrthosiphon pisum]